MHDPGRCRVRGAASPRTGVELPGSLPARAARCRAASVAADRSRMPNPVPAAGQEEAKPRYQPVRKARLYRDDAKARRFFAGALEVVLERKLNDARVRSRENPAHLRVLAPKFGQVKVRAIKGIEKLGAK